MNDIENVSVFSLKTIYINVTHKCKFTAKWTNTAKKKKKKKPCKSVKIKGTNAKQRSAANTTNTPKSKTT